MKELHSFNREFVLTFATSDTNIAGRERSMAIKMNVKISGVVVWEP